MMPSPEKALAYLHTEEYVSSVLGVEGWTVAERTKACLYHYKLPIMQLVSGYNRVRGETNTLRILVEDANDLLAEYVGSDSPYAYSERTRMREALERHVGRLEDPMDDLLRGLHLAWHARNDTLARLKNSNSANTIVVADLQRIVESCARQRTSTKNHIYSANKTLLEIRRREDS